MRKWFSWPNYRGCGATWWQIQYCLNSCPLVSKCPPPPTSPHVCHLVLAWHVLSTHRHNNSHSSPLCDTGGRWQKHPPLLVQKGVAATLFTIGRMRARTHIYTHPDGSLVREAAPNVFSCPPRFLQGPKIVLPTEGWREINSWLILDPPDPAHFCLIGKTGNKGPLGTALLPTGAPSLRPEF